MIGATKRIAESTKKQINLVDMVSNSTAADVDLKLGETFFGQDIAPYKAGDPYSKM